MRNTLFTIILGLMFLTYTFVQASSHSIDELPKCSSRPCPNTTTGEEFTEIEKRESDARREELIQNGRLRKLWAEYWIFSESTAVEDLVLPLSIPDGLRVRFDPIKGVIYFESKSKTQGFILTSPRGDKTSLCPRYFIKIIDGSSTHAVVEQTCFRYEDPRNQFHQSVEYYLYDRESDTMFSLWRTFSHEKNRALPTPNNPPTVKKTPNGYRLIWSAANLSNGSKIKMNTKYYRVQDQKSKDISFHCIDLDMPKNEDSGGYCNAGAGILSKPR